MDTVVLVLLAITVLLAVLFCALRGLKRSLVRLIAVALCGVIALFLAKPAGGALLSALGFQGIELPETLQRIIGGNELLQSILDNLPKMVLAPVVYPVVFGVLCLLANIPVAILNRKKPRDQKGKGALVGIAVGVLSFLLAFGPLLGVASLATSALQQIPEELTAEWIPDEPIDLGIATVNPKEFLQETKLTSLAGEVSKPVLNTLTSTKAGEGTLSLSQEVENLLPLVEVVGVLDNDQSGVDGEALAEQIPVLLEKAEESEVVKEVLDTAVEALAAEYIDETVLDDEEVMEAITDVINRINRGEGEELMEQVKEALAEENIPIPEAAVDYAKDYIGRAFAGTEWTPEQVRAALTDLVIKYAE